jgi:hypothetical protein
MANHDRTLIPVRRFCPIAPRLARAVAAAAFALTGVTNAAQPKVVAAPAARSSVAAEKAARSNIGTPNAAPFDGVWRITRPCDGASQHFDRCRNNDAYLVTTQLTLSRVDDTVCGEIDQILSPLRSAGGFVWGKVYGDTAHVYFSNSGWADAGDAPGEAKLRMHDGKLDWRVTREAAGKWSADSALGLAALSPKRYSVEIWCPSQLGSAIINGLIEQGVQVKWLRYPKIPKRAPRPQSEKR